MDEINAQQHGERPQKRRDGAVALICGVIVIAMVGVSFAAVPLYRLYCQVTGYGGTT